MVAGGSWNSTNGVPGALPCDPSAWCKVQQGWVNVVEVSGTTQALQIMDVKRGDRSVFRVDINAKGTGGEPVEATSGNADGDSHLTPQSLI